MKTTQFVLAATVALVAVASAQSPAKKADDASATHHPNSASNGPAHAKAPSSVSGDMAKGKDASDKKAVATSVATSVGKQIKDAKMDKKNAKQAKDSIPAADAGAASHQLAFSGALIGAAAVLGAYL
ncbi:hypothetical protein GGI07_004758 [Coemansia sp. Benny D115]|nr:hypothetical protein GGI07_004758 [Coemansia sp. Benny D115]